MRLIVFLFLMLFGYTVLVAQTSEIKGVIKDMEMDGLGLPFANVYVEVDGKFQGTATDMDGCFKISGLPKGVYNVTCEYLGYNTEMIADVEVDSNSITFINFKMYEDDICLGCDFVFYKIPLLPNQKVGLILTDDEINEAPTKNLKDIISTTPGVFAPF